jgi:hypothetical protein
MTFLEIVKIIKMLFKINKINILILLIKTNRVNNLKTIKLQLKSTIHQVIYFFIYIFKKLIWNFNYRWKIINFIRLKFIKILK